MKNKIYFALILMGFTSLVVQTLLIREFLISFYGNELTIGLILANWIILEALGSGLFSKVSLFAKRPYLIYALLQTGIALYLPLSIFFIRNIKNIMSLSLGEGIGVLPVFFGSLFILLPLSLFDGAQFPFGCRILQDTQKKPLESIGRVYILEATGFILAGPVFTYLLITKFNSFLIAFLLGLLNLSSAILILREKLSDTLTKFFFIIISLLFGIETLGFLGPAKEFQKLSINQQWKGQKVLSYQNSIYGNLAVTKLETQYTFYSNGIPIITTPIPDIISVEESVHFCMLSHPNPKSILLLSGGAGGVIKEVLKYPIEKLTYTELDPLIIKLIKDFPTELTQQELSNPRTEIKHIDGRRFLRLTKSKYDVVILNLPMPSTLQLNRFYTKEFFQYIRDVLGEDGIFSLSLPGSLSYLNPQICQLNSSILNTLKNIFYVNIIPGDSNFYLASKRDFKISPEIFLMRLKEKDIETQVLNKPHLEYRLNFRWLKWFNDSLAEYTTIRRNFDFSPIATFYSISYWNSLFSPNLETIFRILDKLNFKTLLFGLLIFGIGLLFLKTIIPKLKESCIGFAIGTTGFVGMSFDLILIYAYQSLYGFVFHHLALLVMAFMTGLTLGGWISTLRLSKIKKEIPSFSKIELSIILFCLMAGPLLIYLNKFPQENLAFVFFFLSGISGFLVGSEFPLANKIYRQRKPSSAGILYALDLLGAWFACLVISIALVPIIGILKTCFLLVALKTISWLYVRT